jgi:serine/threonine protein kinase
MMAQIVLIDAKPAERKKILLELQIMHDCDSPYIISSYGADLAEPNICICMEFMDKGSFDGIYKKIGAIDIKVVGKVAVAVLEGLRYLYDVHRIIHRGLLPPDSVFRSSYSWSAQISSPPTFFATPKVTLSCATLAFPGSSSTRSLTHSLGRPSI